MALNKILSLPYWSRLWIVQEIMLGDRLIVRLGHKLCYYDAEFRQGPVNPTSRPVMKENAPIILSLSLNCNAQEWHYRLPSLARSKQCSEVRDRAFGMLGLVKEPYQFRPDYVMSCEEVLFEIVCRELSRAGVIKGTFQSTKQHYSGTHCLIRFERSSIQRNYATC